jgi:hypothetical protein
MPTALMRFVPGLRVQAANLNSAIVDAVLSARRTIPSLQASRTFCCAMLPLPCFPGQAYTHRMFRNWRNRGKNRVGRPTKLRAAI